MQRDRRLRSAAPRSRAGKLALLALGIAATGYVCARLIVLLADVRPYIGWYLLLAVGIGIVIAVALPWVSVRGARGSARWPIWLMVGYATAVVGSMRYYLSLRFTPPSRIPAVLPPPPLWFVLEIAGLSAVAVSFAAVTLLILAALIEVAVPGQIGRQLRARLTRRATATRHPGPVNERIPARLRLEAPGPAGGWLRGAIHVRPGSLLWEPAMGVHATPAELAGAIIVPDGADRNASRNAKGGRVVTLDTPSGRIQLECGAEIFTLLQRIATDLAKSSQSQMTADER